jgi:hypothetical protein
MASGGDEDAKVGEEKICFVFFLFFCNQNSLFSKLKCVVGN